MVDRKYLPAGTLLLGGVLLLIVLVTYSQMKPPLPPPELQGILRPEFKQLKPFELTGNNGRQVTERDFQGKWSFVFFGYLSCPDVCPTTLLLLNSVHGLLKDESAEDTPNAQVFFISVDPQRDNVETLTKYVTYFNSEFIAATSDKATIDSFAQQFSAGYVIEPESAPGNYLVSHTSAIFLVDPSARLVATLSWPHYASAIASHFKKIKAYISSVT